MTTNQSIQKSKDKAWVGKTVVYYEPYNRNIIDTAKEGTITKVGNKYIHVGTLKFDKETMSSDLPHYRLYMGSLAEFAEAGKLQKAISSLFSSCQKEVDIERPLPLLREVERQLKNLKALLESDNE